MADNGAVAQFGYSNRGKLRSAALPGWTVSFVYDNRALLTDIRFSTGAWMKLIYNANGEPVQLQDSSGQTQQIAGLAAEPGQGQAIRSVD